ncbi:MAG: AraC family transcriptional regulator [Bacteroidota bacterium]
MKAELEVISPLKAGGSFHYFKVVEEALDPYWHYHPEIELTLIVKGEGTRYIGNHISSYADGDLVLVGEHLPHHWVSNKQKAENFHEAIVIQFNRDIFSGIPELKTLDQLIVASANGLYFPNPPERVITHLKIFDNLNDVEQLCALFNLLDLLNQSHERTTLSTFNYNFSKVTSSHHSKVERVTTYIIENLDRKITVSEMARLTNFTPESFCRWFKKALGNTFITFLNTARVESACQYLLHTDLSISQIAHRTGFENLTHFNRVFRKYKFVAPSRYRKSPPPPAPPLGGGVM